MKSLINAKFFCVLFCLLFINFSQAGTNERTSSSLEDFLFSFKNAVESQDEKAMSSFYDQTQPEFLKKEISKWKNIFYSGATKDLKIKHFSLGGNRSEQVIIYDITSPNPLFNLLLSNTIHPYVVHRTEDGWRFFGEKRLSEYYVPISEEINAVIEPGAHEMTVTQKIQLKFIRDDVTAVVFILSDELKVFSCSEGAKSLRFEQFGNLLQIALPMRKSGDKLMLAVKYGGKVEKYKALNNHYISNNGGVLRSENFWRLCFSSYEESLPRPIRLVINLPKEFFAVSDGGRHTSSKTEGNRLVQEWEIPPAESRFVGLIYYSGWITKTYNTGINNIILCLDKNTKLDGKKIIELSLDIMRTYQNMFGKIPARDLYLLDYDFGFTRENYIPANADILPHELSHLWWTFPDELWLTEGFAEYADALYIERSKGHEAFLKRLNALNQELTSIIESGLDLPLAGSGYNQLIYKKGALVVQALRLELGDELFFKTLHEFIIKFHNKDAKWKDFSSVAEASAGRNLGFFFDQWLLRPGLPDIELEYETVQDGKSLRLNGKVIQKGPIYRLSSKLEISGRGLREEHELLLDKNEVSFTFPVSFTPEFVDFNIGEGLPFIIKGAVLSVQKANVEAAGVKALNDHNYKKALDSFLELLNLPLNKEENALTCYRMGKTLFGLGKYLEAEGQFKRAVNYPELPQASHYASILYLGKCNLCRGDREKAKEYFDQLITTHDTPEDYKTEAERFSQYLGLLKPPPNEVTTFVEGLQAVINNKNAGALKALSSPVSKEAEMRIVFLAESNPFEDFRINVELTLDAGNGKYHLECFAKGILGKRVESGDVVLLLQNVNGQIKIIDLIKVDMN